MKRFKIYQVNGLGKKTEITTIVADSFQLQIWASAKSINFYQHEVGWFGRTEAITLIGTYVFKDGARVLVEEVLSE